MSVGPEDIQVFYSEVVPKIAIGIVIVLATVIVVKVVRKLLRKLLNKECNPLPDSSIFTNLATAVICAMGASVLLSTCFGFDLTAAVAALGVGGIAISLGCQDTISNLVGGLQISLAGTVTPGEFIEVAGKRGIVHDVNLRYTHVETLAGEMVIIPNATMNSQSVVRLPQITCIKIPLRIWNTAKDLDKVSSDILDAVKSQVKGIVIDPARNTPRIVFCDISDYTFGAIMTVDVEEGVDYVTARDQAFRAAAPFIVPEGSNINA